MHSASIKSTLQFHILMTYNDEAMKLHHAVGNELIESEIMCELPTH